MKEYKFFLDTNIFLRPIVKDNLPAVKDCEVIFELLKGNKFKAFTSTLILAELVWTGISFYKISKAQMIDILKALLKLKGLKFIDKFNLLDAVSFYEANNIKFIDALISSIPWILGGKMKIISYDKDFDKFGDWRIEPKEIVKNRVKK